MTDVTTEMAKRLYWADVMLGENADCIQAEWRDNWWQRCAEMPLSGPAFVQRWKTLAHAALAGQSPEIALREALCVVRGSIGDLRKGFAKSVDPARWVEQAVAHIDAALADTSATARLTPTEQPSSKGVV